MLTNIFMTVCCFLYFMFCFQASRYAESLDNAVWTNQFDNTANRHGHYLTTGPEIWKQTGTYICTLHVPYVHMWPSTVVDHDMVIKIMLRKFIQ